MAGLTHESVARVNETVAPPALSVNPSSETLMYGCEPKKFLYQRS